MTTNERAAYLVKKIWEDADLEAAEHFRNLIGNESVVLYREKPEDFNQRPLFYHGGPIVHEYSLQPFTYEINIGDLISAIGKNDIIEFTICEDNQILERVQIHVFSGLLSKHTENHTILFPHVVRNRGCNIVLNGDVVEYITVVDQRHHCGKVQNVEDNKVWIKEYAGYSFDHDEVELFQQDSWAEKMVCLPLDACVVLSQDDYRVDDMNHASIIYAIWKNPCCEVCDELRTWFTHKREKTVVYYIKCESKDDLECPHLYTVKELAEREVAKRTSETIRQVTLPESCVKGRAFLVPNTDEAARAMGAKVTYTKRNWSVVEISINDLVSKFPSDRYSFQVDGLVDFSGEPVFESSVFYSPTTGMISTCYKDLDEEINSSYPHTLNTGNHFTPPVGSVIQYRDHTSTEPIIAKVTAILGDMVRVVNWEGITYKKEQIHFRGQDEWTSSSITYVPRSACNLIPDIKLSPEQLSSILRFENENELVRAPWGRFSSSEKIRFDINNIVCGLDNLRAVMPEMFVGWIRFVSSDYLTNIDPAILKIAEQYISWIDSVENYGDGTALEEHLNGLGGGYFELVHEMSIAIDKIYFPETDDIY